MDLNTCSVITTRFKILKFPNDMFAVIPWVQTAAQQLAGADLAIVELCGV